MPAVDLDSWRSLPIKQQPHWPDAEKVAEASRKLAAFPPLVFAGEVDKLRERLAAAASGNAFLLQGLAQEAAQGVLAHSADETTVAS